MGKTRTSWVHSDMGCAKQYRAWLSNMPRNVFFPFQLHKTSVNFKWIAFPMSTAKRNYKTLSPQYETWSGSVSLGQLVSCQESLSMCVWPAEASSKRSVAPVQGLPVQAEGREATYFQPPTPRFWAFLGPTFLAAGSYPHLRVKQLTLWQRTRGCGWLCHEKACVTLCSKHQRAGKPWPVASSRGGQSRSQEVTWTDWSGPTNSNKK